MDPQHRQALRETQRIAYQGDAVSRDEYLRRVDYDNRHKEATDKWNARLERYREQLEVKNEATRAIGLKNVRAIDDPDVTFAFDWVVDAGRGSHSRPDFALAMVPVLARLKGPDPIECLVRHAAMSKWPEVRALATAELKQRDWLEFMPYAMANLLPEMRFDSQIDVLDTGEVLYEGRFSIETALFELQHRRSNRSMLVGVRGVRSEPVNAYLASRKLPTAIALQEEDRAWVEEWNKRNDRFREGLCAALREIVGSDHGPEPSDWWDWWTQHNDLYYPMPYGKPTWVTATQTHSCFAPGTPVITLTGKRPIETISPGDQVLAIDPQTGALAFQVVTSVSLRPDAPQLRIRAGRPGNRGDARASFLGRASRLANGQPTSTG